MIYFANPSTASIRDAIREGEIGHISTPNSTRASQWVNGASWCADNGCFSNRFDEARWFDWLVAHSDRADTCRFAVAPDVVGDAAATLERSRPWLPKIRALRYPVAFVAQDGIEKTDVPWDQFDCLFIGGSTEWKLGPIARDYAGQAKARGKWVHMGRVNSLRRYRYAEAIGCDSVDGTFLTFGPDKRLPELLGWIRELNQRPALFGMEV